MVAQDYGEIARAIEDVREAAQLAEAIGLPGELWSIYTYAGTLYQERGNLDQARRAFAHAAMLVHSLANNIEDTQRRTSFLAAQQVRYVLEHGV